MFSSKNMKFPQNVVIFTHFLLFTQHYFIIKKCFFDTFSYQESSCSGEKSIYGKENERPQYVLCNTHTYFCDFFLIVFYLLFFFLRVLHTEEGSNGWATNGMCQKVKIIDDFASDEWVMNTCVDEQFDIVHLSCPTMCLGLDPMKLPDDHEPRPFNSRSRVGFNHPDNTCGLTVGISMEQRLSIYKNLFLFGTTRVKRGGTMIFYWEAAPYHPVFFFIYKMLQPMFKDIRILSPNCTNTLELYVVCRDFQLHRTEVEIDRQRFYSSPHHMPAFHYFLRSPQRAVDDVLCWMPPVEEVMAIRNHKLIATMMTKAYQRQVAKLKQAHKDMWDPYAINRTRARKDGMAAANVLKMAKKWKKTTAEKKKEVIVMHTYTSSTKHFFLLNNIFVCADCRT